MARTLISLVLIAHALLAQSVAKPSVDLDAVRADIRTAIEQQRVPGLSVAVVVDDQLVWSEGFGFADLEAGLHATGSTIYRIGSVSKPVVGTALMQLVEQRKVDLDADLSRYVPQFPKKRWPITTRHLMTHTSGIRHYDGDEFLSRTRYTDLVAPLEIFKDDPLRFEPGTKFSYTTYGFNLVANVVEAASGMKIGDYMQRYVFGPAWMNDTALEDQRAIQRGRAKWYETRDGKWVNAPYVDLSNKYAGGGLTSTVEDLARLHIAYQRGRLMKPETVEQMYTPYRFENGDVHDYGLAWRVATVEVGGSKARLVSHSGGSVGANTLFFRYPDHGVAIAMVANHRARLRQIMAMVVGHFAGEFRER